MSVLGPLLFLIYINDLKACPLSSYAGVYADDTCLTASAIDPEMLQFKLNRDLEVVRSWLHANKLTLNMKKTKCLIIGSNYSLNQMKHNFEVNVNDKSLSRVGFYGCHSMLSVTCHCVIY